MRIFELRRSGTRRRGGFKWNQVPNHGKSKKESGKLNKHGGKKKR